MTRIVKGDRLSVIMIPMMIIMID